MEPTTQDKKLFTIYATKTPQEACDILKTSYPEGLSLQEATDRTKQYGLNQLAQHQDTAWQILFKQIKSPFIYLLIIIAAISFMLQNFAEGSLILVLVIINTVFSFYQEYRIHRALLLLQAYIIDKSRVIRDGKELEINSNQLVPGDIIKVYPGDEIPADIRFITADNITVDESILTGESAPQPKTNDATTEQEITVFNAMTIGFAGTNIINGEGTAVVFATGSNTYFGSIATLAEKNQKLTSFLQGINRFSNFILYIIVITVFGLFITHLLLHGHNIDIITLIIFSMALGITIIPEALPVVTSFSLARGAEHLAKFKVIVKRLSAIEDLGSMQLLCIDKTGTITENKLTLAAMFGANEQQTILYALLASGLNTGQLAKDQGFNGPLWQKISDQDKKKIQEYTVITEHAFEPQLRYASIIVQHQTINELIVRGNVEELLKLCQNLSPEQQKEISAWATEQGEQGHRVLLIAKKEVPSKTFKITQELENNLEYVGLISYVDPLKSTTQAAVSRAQSLGVKIKVISGDTKEVNFAIAQQINLITREDQIISGEEFSKLTETAKIKAVEHCSVFAHILPDQKVEILDILENHYDVGYLGDGINDAPAMKIAHVSLAVNTAADITRNIADILLLHKSLQVIVDGIHEGRIIFANLIKYIKSTLTCNFGHFYSLSIISLFIDFLPMQPAQLLLVSLLTDLPLIAIATDTVSFQDVNIPKKYDLSDILLITTILGLIVMITDLIVFRIFSGLSHEVLQTNWFITIILVELSFFYSIRTKMPFYKATMPSLYMVILSLAVAIFSISLPYTSLGQQLLHFSAPTKHDLGIIFLIVACYFIVTDSIKVLFYRIYGYK